MRTPRLLLACSLLAALSSAAPADPAPAIAQRPAPVLDRDVLRAKLSAARAANLTRFRAYQRRGVFPSNTYEDGKVHVWRDEDGHLCAAAMIMHASGQASLAEKIADSDNFIRLDDEMAGPVLEWILTSGFTQEEIAAIHEPFAPVFEPGLAPGTGVPISSDLRRAENARLARKYRAVEATLVKDQKASLELALAQLIWYPAYAVKLMGS